EELPIEVRRAAAAQESEGVELEDRVPFRHRKLVTAGVLEADARLGDPPALPPRLLALRGAERGEKRVEVLVAPIAPMELAALAGPIAGRREGGASPIRREEAMQRRRVELAPDVLGTAQRRRFDLARRQARRDEEPAPGRRSERDRR